jgi:phosphatidylglycerophosphate synthase
MTAAAPPLQHRALREALYLAPLYAGLAFAVSAFAGFGAAYVLKAVALFAAAAWLIRQAIPTHAPHTRFGAANRVTLARLSLVLLLAAALGESVGDAARLAWGAAALATLAASLDAVDGPLARAGGLASEFGARFDMETDALLVLVLSALVLQFDKAGAWVLAAGLMRYAFVAANRAWPWLARPLPASLRRKAACVAQIVSLIVCLLPPVPPPASAALAAAGLALLVHSFAVDVLWLARARHQPRETTA